MAWRPTWAHVRALLLGGVGVLVAVVFHRPDLLVASTPLVVVAVWGAGTRPGRPAQVTGRLGRTTIREGQATALRVTVEAPGGAQEFWLGCTVSPWVRTRPAYGIAAGLVPRGESSVNVELLLRMTRWGHHAIGPTTVAGLSAWGAYQWGPQILDGRDVEVLPSVPVFDTVAPMPHPEGLVGIDRSARPGDGSEFATIRQFQLGDRLRRIHWPSSLRSNSLNVTATYADHDSQVMVIVDASNDVGVSTGVDGSASTLDSTVRAAAALCEHYVRRGDRVGLLVTGAADRILVRPTTGRPHLRRTLSSLARVSAGGSLSAAREPRLHVHPGALVLMCSPLISSVPMERALGLARRGLIIVVIDTLPEDLDVLSDLETAGSREQQLTELAWRVRMLERDTDVRRLVQAGVPVVPWRGPGSLDQVLRDVSRRARAPRLAPR